jgi:hypothetical protein
MAIHIPKADRKPHIFLSHSSSDKNIGRQLANDLMNCEVDVWLDEWEIETGDSIFNAINDGLDKSRYVALVISNAFLKSKWASEEVQTAFTRQVDRDEKVVLPLIFEKVELPQLLRNKLHLSFIGNYFHSLTRLAAVVHNIDNRTIGYAIEQKNPTNLTEVLDTLYYCGFNPHLIIPKNVFDELSAIPGVEVNGDRLRFPNLIKVLENNSLSAVTRSYLTKIWQGDRPLVQ